MGYWAPGLAPVTCREDKHWHRCGHGNSEPRFPGRGSPAVGRPCLSGSSPWFMRWEGGKTEAWQDGKQSWSQPVLWPVSWLVGTGAKIKTDSFNYLKGVSIIHSPHSLTCYVHVQGKLVSSWRWNQGLLSDQRCFYLPRQSICLLELKRISSLSTFVKHTLLSVNCCKASYYVPDRSYL